MTDTSVERAARALATEAGEDPDARFSDGQVYWQVYVGAARAVLAALREPTGTVTCAGCGSILAIDGKWYGHRLVCTSETNEDHFLTAQVEHADGTREPVKTTVHFCGLSCLFGWVRKSDAALSEGGEW